MAPVKRWVAAVLGACGVIAIAYLPPRGGPQARLPGIFTGQLLRATPARERAQALAAEWRTASAAGRLLQQRARMRSAASQPGDAVGRPTIVLQGAGAMPASAVRLVAATMDSVWQNLRLGETKVRVAIVIDLWEPAAGSAATPAPDEARPTYLEPDSTDRTTCLALIPAGRYWTRAILGEPAQIQPAIPPRFKQWLQASLGPCAFYAAFGAPSRPVRRWLAARQWDVGLYLDWDSIGTGRFSSRDLVGDPRFSWFWPSIYAFPPTTVACLGGRAASCRAAVLGGASGEARDSLPRIVRIERRWWRAQALIPGERYLSDLAREVGRDRFQGFWASPLPVDTALALAVRKPVGEWTEAWQRRYVPRLRLGPAAPVEATLLALLLAMAAVTSAAWSAARRQVR